MIDAEHNLYVGHCGPKIHHYFSFLPKLCINFILLSNSLGNFPTGYFYCRILDYTRHIPFSA